MTVVLVLLAVYAAVGLLYWLATAYSVLRVRRMPELSAQPAPDPQALPSLSVIVPAANEGDKIEPAARTLMRQDYPGLEIILVDDRSTDETPRIVDALAAEDGRVKAVHVAELPQGWLGKVNALRRGLAESNGQFVLFTDADVHFAPGTLRRAVGFCLEHRLDYLTAFPRLWPTTFLLDAAISVFLRQLILTARPWGLSDPNSSGLLGIGAFNLVRRTAFEATEGFEWLRMEMADDVALALMMKDSGARCGIVSAFDGLALHWYRSLAEAARGAEKGYASVYHFSLRRAAIGAAIGLALELSPVLALVPLLFRPVRLAGYGGLGVLAVFVFSVVAVARWAGARVLPTLAGPVVAPLYAVLSIRAAVFGRRRGGVLWRGTLYREEELRRGMRMPLPLPGRRIRR